MLETVDSRTPRFACCVIVIFYTPPPICGRIIHFCWINDYESNIDLPTMCSNWIHSSIKQNWHCFTLFCCYAPNSIKLCSFNIRPFNEALKNIPCTVSLAHYVHHSYPKHSKYDKLRFSKRALFTVNDAWSLLFLGCFIVWFSFIIIEKKKTKWIEIGRHLRSH